MDRVLRRGAVTATAFQVSRQTAYRWMRRYRAEGPAGLQDRPPIARRRPQGRRRGYAFVHVAVYDGSRVAFGQA